MIKILTSRRNSAINVLFVSFLNIGIYIILKVIKKVNIPLEFYGTSLSN